MVRVVLVNLLVLLLPFIVYFAYVRLTRPEKQASEVWSDTPIFWLLSAGAMMMIVALVTLVSFNVSEQGGRYVPPAYKDGKIIPGHYEPIEKSKDRAKGGGARDGDAKEKVAEPLSTPAKSKDVD